MSDVSDLDDGSLVEYSLAELGFVLVFVLLLLSGWEINSNAANLEEEEKNRAELQRQLEAEKKELATLKALIAWFPTEATEFPDDFMFVAKKDYLALQARADDALQVLDTIGPELQNLEPPMLAAITKMASSTETPPIDPVIVSEKKQRELESTLENLQKNFVRLSDRIASIPESKDELDVGKVGTVGFCTYELPNPSSKRVYGKSVALGTLLVEEDGITLVGVNNAIQKKTFVDIAGVEYDTTLVINSLQKWPINVKLTPEEFRRRGSTFVEIGDIPSDKRVECRFGMDYYIPIISKKSFAMLKNVVEGSFYKNSEVSDANFARLFPGHNFTLDASVTDVPAAKNQELKRLGLVSKSSSSKNNSSIVDPQVTNPPSILKTPVEVLSKVTPVFPRAAKQRGISGVVELVYKVSESGQAIDVKIIKEEPIGKSFGDASMAAIKQYRFKPATENGIRITSDERKLRFRF